LAEKCDISMSVTNRFPKDVQGNYIDIAFLNKSGMIIDRQKGIFETIFQSGYTSTIPLKTRVRCEDVEGIKVYSLSFTNPATSQITESYRLEIVGFTLTNSK
jgi:hypothetical protein